jgi:hypothetical protein
MQWTPESIIAWITLTGLLVTGITAIWRRAQQELKWRQTLEVKVNAIWEFHMSRARLKANRFAPQQVGFNATRDIREAFDSIAADLRLLWAGRPRGMTEDDFALVIHQHHGEWIVENICTRFDVTDGQCLVWATMIAKETGKSIREAPNWMVDSDQ